MPLQRDTSSAVYWQDAGLDDPDIDEALLLDQQQGQAGGEGKTEEHQVGDHVGHDAAILSASTASEDRPSTYVSTSINHPVNRQASGSHNSSENSSASSNSRRIQEEHLAEVRTDMQVAEEDEDEEVTFNPDMELQDAQAAQHGYEDAQFYEKINFGEFGKYMQNKRRKLGVQQGAFKLNAKEGETSSVLKGLRIHVSCQ